MRTIKTKQQKKLENKVAIFIFCAAMIFFILNDI
jgi:hypothetical protein